MYFATEGEKLTPGKEPHHAPGVRGYAIEKDGKIYIPLVIADQEGNGDVGRWIDGLPKDRDIIFPTILNQRLGAMLLRRGFFLCDHEAQPAIGRGPGVKQHPRADIDGRTTRRAMSLAAQLLQIAAEEIEDPESFETFHTSLVSTLLVIPLNGLDDTARGNILRKWAEVLPRIPRLTRDIAEDLGVPVPPGTF